MNTIQTIIESLQKAHKAATMDNMCLGTPGERVQVFSQDGAPLGEPLHPTDYVIQKTKLYRESWIIPQIEKAISILEANAELLRRIQALAEAMDKVDLERIHDLARASMGGFDKPRIISNDRTAS